MSTGPRINALSHHNGWNHCYNVISPALRQPPLKVQSKDGHYRNTQTATLCAVTALYLDFTAVPQGSLTRERDECSSLSQIRAEFSVRENRFLSSASDTNKTYRINNAPENEQSGCPRRHIFSSPPWETFHAHLTWTFVYMNVCQFYSCSTAVVLCWNVARGIDALGSCQAVVFIILLKGPVRPAVRERGAAPQVAGLFTLLPVTQENTQQDAALLLNIGQLPIALCICPEFKCPCYIVWRACQYTALTTCRCRKHTTRGRQCSPCRPTILLPFTDTLTGDRELRQLVSLPDQIEIHQQLSW